MKISYNQLKNYLAFNLTPQDVAEILTNTGLEVEAVTPWQSVRGGLEGVVIGEIIACEKHPEADKLQVTRVNIGTGEPLQIICGAPNCRVGLLSPVALVGTTLYPFTGESFQLKKAKIRGVESQGMLCAADELGLGESHAGIMELPVNAKPGTPAADYFGVENDWLIEIGLTPNRSDAFSHIGVARDLAAALHAVYKIDLPLIKPVINFKAGSLPLPIHVEVQNPTACKRYSAVSITGITVSDSPQWLQNKLKVIGLRPINNVVDVTNFVLHEYGQPLHAFDADKINGRKIIVRNATAGEAFKTLDAQELTLTSDDLLIADVNNGLCIAGIYGGLESGVTTATKTIFLESAHFDAITIRKTAARYGLRTDSAQHFEKGADINICVEALQRAADLIVQLAGGVVSSSILDIYPQPFQGHEVQISIARIQQLAGTVIPVTLIRSVLEKLEISILKEEGDQWQLLVPTFRTDVKREADIVEEVLRIYGYNSIPIPTKINASIAHAPTVDAQQAENTAADYLVGRGLREISTNSIAQAQWEQDENLQRQQVRLLNSQTAELDSLRTSMLYAALEVVNYNTNRKQNDLAFFEFGKTYHRANDGYVQQGHLSLLLTGKTNEANWLDKGMTYNFFHLKSAVEDVLHKMGIENFDTQAFEKKPYTFGAHVTTAPLVKNEKCNTILATYGQVSDSILQQFDIKQPVFFADINWDAVLARLPLRQLRFRPLPKFPSVRRDLAMLVDETLAFAQIEETVKKDNNKWLREINLFDVFKSEKLGTGKKSYAVSFIFSDSQKTLTDAEIDKAMSRLMRRLESDLKVEIRK